MSPDILPYSVLMNGPLSPIEPIFLVKPLTPEILPCSVLMDGPLVPNKGNNKITELRTILQRESQNS